ncbi:MAG: energy transducer TonB [Terracidiphilus sp.]|jgi:TonB family protein
MRLLYFFVLSLAAVLPGFGQTAGSATLGLPKDPRAIFAAAAPFYDFTSPELKPWHLKATYQLYDENGKPTEQGTYEYWWVSPKIHRSSWTRPGVTHTDWYTADGKHAYQASGEPLKFFEYKLQSALFSPLPDSDDLDPAKVRLDREPLGAKGNKLPCIMVVPLMPQHGRIQTVPLGLFPTYCFDPQLPALRVSSSFGATTTEFSNIVKAQNRYLAREILITEGKRKILSATVDLVTWLDAADPALKPATVVALPYVKSVNVADVKKVNVSGGVMAVSIVKKEQPVYPQDAKDAQITGTVVLRATIGIDGEIHDLHVVSAPWPSLAASALWAVSHWEYKPYLLSGEPVEVETTVNVIYTLGP